MILPAIAAVVLNIATIGQRARVEFPDVTRIPVLPSATDSNIKKYDTDHVAYIDSKVKPRNQLVVFMTGTNGKGTGAIFFCSTAAELGYHVVNVTYPTDVPATAARKEKDPDAMKNFRLEIIEGGDKSKFVDVDRANSIENRLIKLLQYLDKNRPTEKWGQFLDGKGQIEWSKTVPAGHSQGAGHAALIAIRHKVARVVMTGGPKDYNRYTGKPAAWYTEPKTPINRFFNFNHIQDKQGCDYEEQLEICHVMGMDKAGGPVSVDTEKPPYKNTRILTTNYPGTPMESIPAHVSVMADGTAPRNPDGSLMFKPVWVYMLSTAVK